MSEPSDEVTLEELDAAMGDPPEQQVEMEEPPIEQQNTAQQRLELEKWLSKYESFLLGEDESSLGLGPAAPGLLLGPSAAAASGAVVEVPGDGDVPAVAAATARAVIQEEEEEMVGDGVAADLQQESHRTAPALTTQLVQHHGVVPLVVGPEGAPNRGPQTTGDMLHPAAAAVPTQDAQDAVLAPSVVGGEDARKHHDPQKGGAEVQQMTLHPAAAAVATQVAQDDFLAPLVFSGEEARKHGPQTGGAEMHKMTLHSTAAAVIATQTMQDDVLAQVLREPYSETTVIHLINQDRWIDLQTYLLSYMPQDGKDLNMEHAHLILRCRKEILLNMLNANCDPVEAESYFNNSIVPLGLSTSKYVNSAHLNREIQSICDGLNGGRNFTSTGAQDYIKDYMDFHFPNVTRYKQGRSAAWHFMVKIEVQGSGRGTVIARCKLCQNRMPAQNSGRNLVVTHIGGKKCTNLTLYAEEQYNSLIAGVDPTKRKARTAAGDSGPGKTHRVDTEPVNVGRTHGGLLKDINNSIDDVFSSVDDLSLMSNAHNKANVKCRIQQTLEKIKTSVNLLVAQTAASTMAGVVPPFQSNKVTGMSNAPTLPPVLSYPDSATVLQQTSLHADNTRGTVGCAGTSSTSMMPPLLTSSVEIPDINFDNTVTSTAPALHLSHPVENTMDDEEDSHED